MSDLVARLRASLELTLLGLLLAVVVGLPLGILAATRPNTWIDQLTQLRIYLPTFFTGLVLIYVFYYLLGWSPAPLGRLDLMLLNPPETVTGFYLIDIVFAGDWEVFRSALVQLILPAVTLGFFALAPLVRNSIGSSATPPAITVGWDWQVTARDGQTHFIPLGYPRSNLMFIDAERPRPSGNGSIPAILGRVLRVATFSAQDITP